MGKQTGVCRFPSSARRDRRRDIVWEGPV
jgi:hypothetical protein